jgi:uncharacterized protein YjbI with pentapeptide repeats
MARGWKSLRAAKRLRSDRVSLHGLGVGLAGAVLAAIVGRATGAGWLSAIGLAALLGFGLYLWARDKDKGWGDLGQGILVGVVVAIALMSVQRDADQRTREADEQRDRQLRDSEARRQRAADRQNLQLTLTLEDDLSGIALSGRDLSGFFLAGKDFKGADLHDADLTGADLRGSKFRRADLRGTRFDKANMAGADLRGVAEGAKVSFRRANLDDARLGWTARVRRAGSAYPPEPFFGSADMTGASLSAANLRLMFLGQIVLRDADLAGADLSGAYFPGADLRGAKLHSARVCGAFGLKGAKLEGAEYNAQTR